jgi:hypothetical protein
MGGAGTQRLSPNFVQNFVENFILNFVPAR